MKKQENDIIFRRCDENDSVEDIALCLYQTDPYIYPFLCNDDISVWTEMVKQCLSLPNNFFNGNNLFVADSGGKTVGIICAVRGGNEYSFSDGLKYPERLSERVKITDEGYFIPLAHENKELEGYNITNVCIAEDYRRKGIGEKMLERFLETIGNETAYLVVLSDNYPAISLYKKYGFKQIEEKEGFKPYGTVTCGLYRREKNKDRINYF